MAAPDQESLNGHRPLVVDLSDDPEIAEAERVFTETVRRVLAKRSGKPAKPTINELERRLEVTLRDFLQGQAGKVADQIVAAYGKHSTGKVLKVFADHYPETPEQWGGWFEESIKNSDEDEESAAKALALFKATEGKIVLIRHAEKLETSPHLSAQGHLHAERLAETIPEEYGVPDVVYAAAEDADSHRPVETARPLVDKYGIKFKDKIPHGDIRRLVKAVLKKARKGKFVLVVWRHDELPAIARALGMKDVPAKWPDDDFSTQWEIDVNKKGDPIEKMGRAPIRRTTFQGFPISIENEAGTYREWKGGRTLCVFPYGYIRRTMGEDGDHVDCYLGPNENATHVYVVRQIDSDTGNPDEDKCFLGFDSPVAAREAFLAHRNDGDKAYGGMDTYTVEEFRQKVHATMDRPGAVKAYNPESASDARESSA